MESQPYEISSPPRTRRSLKLLQWAAVFLFVGILAAHAAGFKATLDKDSITLGESATLMLTFDGAQPQDTPTPPTVANLQIRYVGPSSEFSFVNGQTSSRVTHNFSVIAKQAGEYTIPAISAELNGQRLATQPLRLKVLKPNSQPANNAAFMRLVLPKTNIFLGEILTGTFELYLREGSENWGQFQFTATPTEGMTIGKVTEGQRQRVQLGNAVFTVIPLSFVASPIKTGPLNIGPVTASISATLPPRNSNEMFFGGQRTQVSLATEMVSLQCYQIPTANAPPDFNGAVGNYSMTASIGPTNVATGDPITVRVQISGRGALDAIILPEQKAWGDFKIYPPTARVETVDPMGLQGTKTFEQILSPENSDVRELPAFSFSYFDPDVKQFRTLNHPATKLTVRPGGTVVAPVIAAKSGNTSSDTPPPQQDIVPIKQRLGTLSKTFTPLITRPVFIAAQATPLLAFLAAFIWRKRADSFANNPRLRRQRQVEATIRTGLENIRQLAAQNKSDEFFAELAHLLQEKLGERLDTSASGITEAVIDEKLRPRGIPDSVLTELHELFQACNLARYAPIKSSHELTAIIPRLEGALKKLDEVKA